MGYVHYWTFNVPASGAARNAATRRYYQACIEIAHVVYTYAQQYGGVSGHTAHTAPGDYGGVHFNGSTRAGSCEDFVLREFFIDNTEFNFCKTNQHTYDILVTAALSILAARMGKYVTVASDGVDADWVAGAALASNLLDETIPVPVTILPARRQA